MIVCVIGDSLSNTDPGNWVALAARERPDLSFAVEAHGGWTTHSYFKGKFDGVAFANVPATVDLFILLLGSNNLFEDRGGSDESVAGAVAGIERIAARVAAPSPRARFMLVAPPTVCLRRNVVDGSTPDRFVSDVSPVFLGKLSSAYRQLAGRRGWMFVDLFPVLGDDDFVDVAHPNPAGNRKMADQILRALP